MRRCARRRERLTEAATAGRSEATLACCLRPMGALFEQKAVARPEARRPAGEAPMKAMAGRACQMEAA